MAVQARWPATERDVQLRAATGHSRQRARLRGRRPDRKMKAFEAATGKELWATPHDRSGYQSPEDPADCEQSGLVGTDDQWRRFG